MEAQGTKNVTSENKNRERGNFREIFFYMFDISQLPCPTVMMVMMEARSLFVILFAID